MTAGSRKSVAAPIIRPSVPLAAVREAPDGATLQALAERLLGGCSELLGVLPTFVGEDAGA